MKAVTKLSYIRHFQKIFFNCILHFIFRKQLQSSVMKALTIHVTLITMQITMKACFHCIGIMLVICQDVSAYYICYIDIYPRSYESLFSLCWHIVS